MCVLSLGVLVTTFPGRAHHILVPSLLPVFGAWFGLLYLAAQAAVVAWLKSRRGALMLAVAAAVGAVLGGTGRALDLFGMMSQHNMGYLRQSLVGGAVAGGLVLGVALARGQVVSHRDRT